MSLKHRAKRAAKLRDYGHEFNREAVIAWEGVVTIRRAAGAKRTREHNAERAANHAARELAAMLTADAFEAREPGEKTITFHPRATLAAKHAGRGEG